MKQLIACILTICSICTFAAEEETIDWRKLDVNVRRQKTRDKKQLADGIEKIETVELTVTMENDNKIDISDLEVEAIIIGEKATDDDKHEVIAKKVTKKVVVPARDEVRFSGIVSKISMTNKTVIKVNQKAQNADDALNRRSVIQGMEYHNWVVLVRDSEGKLLVVKTENIRGKRTAVKLGIFPEDLETDRHGRVEYDD